MTSSPPKVPSTTAPADPGSLTWSRPVCVDRTSGYAPMVLALSRDRFVMTWLSSAAELTRKVAAATYTDKAVRESTTTAFTDGDLSNRPLCMAPIVGGQVIIGPKGPDEIHVCKVTVGTDNKVTAAATKTLGHPSYTELGIIRIGNDVYVATGLRYTLRSFNSAVCTFKLKDDGTPEHFKVRQVSGREFSMSMIPSRDKNRFALGLPSGLHFYEVKDDSEITKLAKVSVGDSYPKDWFQCVPVDMGNGKAVLFYRFASDTRMMIVDLQQPDSGVVSVGAIDNFEKGYGPRRPCFAKGHLYIPSTHKLDVIKATDSDPKKWTHVKTYAMEEMFEDGFPCMVGSNVVLVYRSTDPLRSLKFQYA